jgi:hypothetical protein
MELYRILITEPIVVAVKKLNPLADLSIYKRARGEQGFALTRLTGIESKGGLITLKKVPNMGVRKNGVLNQLYEIIDGRHRVAYAIASGESYIDAEILED